ncbi:cadherin-like beta sandwich domain-containing protein [Paenibacillus sp. HJGM_3]|uniref:cadherin-like beta sandwich domain-containing protein n=1 Tax=Paenibacillus sp. HJGM_3 TaxID=3379816 RepID=UPI00385E8992
MFQRFMKASCGCLAFLLFAVQLLGGVHTASAVEVEPALSTIIIDNDNNGAPNVSGGLPTTTSGYSSSGMAGGGAYSSLAYAKGSQNANSNTAYARYTPSLSGQGFEIGTYRVSVWIVKRTSFHANLKVDVFRNGVSTTAVFPNLDPAGGWVEVGTFDFQGSGDEYVKLSRDPNGPTGYFNTDSVKFERLGSRHTTLSDLKIGSFSIYQPSVTDFTYNVSHETSSITIVPLTADPKATVTVAGNVVARGESSAPLALAVGDNWIPIEVTAENINFKKQYSLHVKRSSGSSRDADLSSLQLNGADLPGFDRGVTEYTYTVNHDRATLGIKPIASFAEATVRVNGSPIGPNDPPTTVPLEEGSNSIRIDVIAQDPAYTKTYTLTVIRQKADAKLRSLLINGRQPTRGYNVASGENNSPGFEPGVTDYAYNVAVGVNSITLTTIPNDPNAAVSINGASVNSTTYTATLPVAFGVQTFRIEIQAEDRAYTQTYNLTVGQGDHAQGKPSRVSGEYYLTPGKNAVDGDGSTVWRTVLADGTPYIWLEVDLLRRTTFDRAIVAFYNYADMRNFKIQYSDDGNTWQDAYLKESAPSSIEIVRFPEVTARYVRFYADKARESVYIGLYAMEIYGPDVPSDVKGDEYERLSGISLSGGTVAFDPYKTDYTVVTDRDITVSPVKAAEGQTLTIDGVTRDTLVVEKESLYGKPRTVTIQVTSKDGSRSMEYRLHIELVPSVPGSGYTLAFADEFDGTTLNEDSWFYRTGGNTYSDNKKDNVSVSDGYLRIALKKEPAGSSKGYSGGGVITKQLLGYGYYETRFKQHNKAGFHSSFWVAGMNPKVQVLDGDRIYSPSTDYQVNEIDGFEIETGAPNEIKTAAHLWWPGDSHTVPVPYLTYTNVDSSDGYHTYGFEWTPTKLKYYIDGKLFREEFYTGPHGAGTQGRGQHLWLTSLVYQLPVDDSGLPGEVTYDYFRFYTNDYGLNAPDGAILIDNGDAGYSETGTWTSTGDAFGYDDNDTRFTRTPGDRAEWKANIAHTGTYEVKIWNPSYTNNSTQAKYTVLHADGTTDVSVDQKLGGQQWISLGTFRFNDGAEAKVILTAMDPAFTRTDTVMFVPITLAPETPAGPSAGKLTGRSVSLNWTASNGADGYKLYRASAEEGPYSLIYTGAEQQYTDTTVAHSADYYYTASAYNAAGESAVSAPSFVRTLGQPADPATPAIPAVPANPADPSNRATPAVPADPVKPSKRPG